MKTLIAFLILLGVTACSVSPSRAIAHADFTRDNVFGGAIVSQAAGKTFNTDRKALERILFALDRITDPKRSVGEPTHLITLYKGSSFESQKLKIVVDATGEGYFKQGAGREVQFYSDELKQLMKSYK